MALDMTDQTLEDAIHDFNGPSDEDEAPHLQGLDIASLPGNVRGKLKGAKADDVEDGDKRSCISVGGRALKDTTDPAAKKPKFEDRFDMAEDDDGYDKSARLQGFLQKLLQALQASEFETKKAKYHPDSNFKKDLKVKMDTLTKLCSQLNVIVIQKQASKAKVKALLLAGVGHYREGTDMLAKIIALNKPASLVR